MKCYRHPDKDAIYECAFCGKPVCADCIRFSDDDDGTPICIECTSESVLSATTEDISLDDLATSDIREKMRKGRAKLNAFDVLNPWLLILFFLLVGAILGTNYYLSKSAPLLQTSGELVQKAGNPSLEMSRYLAAIFAYANDHNGTLPEKLEKLYPDYIDKSFPYILATQDKYIYAVESKQGFVLSVPIAERFGFKKMYANKEGIIHIE